MKKYYNFLLIITLLYIVNTNILIAQCPRTYYDCVIPSYQFTIVGTTGSNTNFQTLINNNCILSEANSSQYPQYLAVKGMLTVDNTLSYSIAPGSVILFLNRNLNLEASLKIEGALLTSGKKFMACDTMWKSILVAAGGIFSANSDKRLI